jgi:hypothetical protein
MTTLPSDIIEAMTSPDWWGPWFARGDWRPWQVFLKGLFGLPLDPDEWALFQECTGCNTPPVGRMTEAYACVGRRGGKTRIMALVAAWLAVFEDWQQYLDPGENAHVLIIAKDQTQAGVCFGYLSSLLVHHPLLNDLVISETADSITLSNRVIVRVASASFRGLRGYAVAGLLGDELAYWFDGETSANPAEEILAAVKPGMLQFGGKAMLLAGSSPYRKAGPLWDAFRRHWGKPSPVLFWRAPTLQMNALADKREIERAYEEDPEKAAAEYGAEFRSDLAPFIDRERVEALVAWGRGELLPVREIAYRAFVDPSGGSHDSFTLAIAHRDRNGIGILDCVREFRAPFNPTEVVGQISDLLKSYRIHRVEGDKYAAEWPIEAFSKFRVAYDVCARTKSEIYLAALPLLNAGRVELYDNQRLISQICSLERRTARGGRESIDHPIGGRDDLANAALGALLAVTSGATQFVVTDEMIAAIRPSPYGPQWRARQAGTIF